MSNHIIRRVWRRLTPAIVIAASPLLIIPVGIARADGVIDDTEYAYISTWGPVAICPVIDEYPSAAGVVGVMRGIMDDGMTADSAVDIINASVHQYCPRHWSLLQAIGRAARGETLVAGHVGGVLR